MTLRVEGEEWEELSPLSISILSVEITDKWRPVIHH